MKEAGSETKTLETKTFSKSFIEQTIKSLLESPEAKEKIDKIVEYPKIEGSGNELTIKTMIESSAFNIKITAILENKGGIITKKSHKIDTSMIIKGRAEKALIPILDKIPKYCKRS